MNKLLEEYLEKRKKNSTTIYPDHMRKETRPYSPVIVAAFLLVFFLVSAAYLGLL